MSSRNYSQDNDKQSFSVRYPIYEVDQCKSGFCVKLIEKGGKHNAQGIIFYCDHEAFFVRSKLPLTAMSKEEAYNLRDELSAKRRNEDKRSGF